MAEGSSDRVHTEDVVLDIGQGFGALLIYTTPELRGTEIEVSRVGDDAARPVHAEVLERRVGGEPVFAAVLAALPEGDYRIRTDDSRLRNVVTIRGGEVAEVDWR
jgi:hypothetical protein